MSEWAVAWTVGEGTPPLGLGGWALPSSTIKSWKVALGRGAQRALGMGAVSLQPPSLSALCTNQVH